MTRKHFQKLAEALLDSRPEPQHGAGWQVWADTVMNVATACKASNNLFDADKFFEAAGYTGNYSKTMTGTYLRTV